MQWSRKFISTIIYECNEAENLFLQLFTSAMKQKFIFTIIYECNEAENLFLQLFMSAMKQKI